MDGAGHGRCWERARIGELGEVRVGRQRSPKNHDGPSMRPYLRVANVFEDRLDFSDVMEMNFSPAEASIFELRPGDILLNEGQSLELVGRPAMYQGELPGVCFTNSLVRFRPGPRIDGRYALRMFQYFMHSGRFLSIAKITTNLAHLGGERFAAIEVDVPPIAQQREMAVALDRADAVRRKRHEALALTDVLLRATFLEMFGDPLLDSKRWPLEPLGTHVAITAGWSASGEARPAAHDEQGVLKVSAVTSGWYRPEENKVVGEADLKGRELVVPRRGDLLFSRANTRELVAAVCLVDLDAPNVFLPDKLWRMEPTSGRLRAEYLRYLLSDPQLRSRIAATASGSSGSMLNVSQEKVLAQAVPIPSQDRQEQFSRFVWKTYDCRRTMLRTLNESERMFASLQHRAFQGEL